MGLFNKLFGQSDKKTASNGPNPQQTLTPSKSVVELIERFSGIAFDKQIDLVKVIGSNNWNVDMTQGTISFGQNLVFPMQVLGTFSHSTKTWLWTWANTKSGLSASMTQQALKLKNYGEENKIDLLQNDTFDFSQENLHLIGLIACGIFNSSGYYIADYGQGAMVVTIKSDKIDMVRKENHHRILTVFPQLISQFDMNHKRALTNYLTEKGYQISESGNTITATKNGNIMKGQFDEESRLTSLNG